MGCHVLPMKNRYGHASNEISRDPLRLCFISPIIRCPLWAILLPAFTHLGRPKRQPYHHHFASRKSALRKRYRNDFEATRALFASALAKGAHHPHGKALCLQMRPVIISEAPHKVRLLTSFVYQARSRQKPQRIVCKAEVSDLRSHLMSSFRSQSVSPSVAQCRLYVNACLGPMGAQGNRMDQVAVQHLATEAAQNRGQSLRDGHPDQIPFSNLVSAQRALSHDDKQFGSSLSLTSNETDVKSEDI